MLLAASRGRCSAGVAFGRLAAPARRRSIATRARAGMRGVALAALVVAIAWNTRAVGGSDSSCYVLQAEAFARGRVALRHPLPSFRPARRRRRWRRSVSCRRRSRRIAAVPICAPGLALADGAGASRRPRRASFSSSRSSPRCGLVHVLCWAGAMDDDVTRRVGAALLVACSPIFLYQAVQPMSDVPAAALWLAALVALRPPGIERHASDRRRRCARRSRF